MSKKESERKISKEEEILIEETKKTSIKEASAWSFMDGFGFRYITPYALALGASSFHIGLLNSIPLLIGNASQLATIKAMYRYSRKKIVFAGIFLQAIMWLALLIAGSVYFILDIKNSLASYLIIIIYTLLMLFGAFAGPAWTSWMKDIVLRGRGRYFGKRAEISGTIAIACMLTAGFILDYFKNTKIFTGFIILFSIAFLGRLISSFLILKQYEPNFKPEKHDYFSLMQFVRRAKGSSFRTFVFYFALIAFSVSIASPFFAVYMLKNLGFSYINYMTVILSTSIATLIFFPIWGKFADKYGNIKVMKITGAFIPILPIFWLISAFVFKESMTLTSTVIFLAIVEALAGTVWAGFNLSAGNFIYDAVSREKIAICTSYFSILAGLGIVAGALLGGIIASLNFSFFGLTPILFIFFLSAIIRLGVYVIVGGKIKEITEVEKFGFREAERTAEKFGEKELVLIEKEFSPLRKLAESFNILHMFSPKIRTV